MLVVTLATPSGDQCEGSIAQDTAVLILPQKHETPLCRETLYLHLVTRWAP